MPIPKRSRRIVPALTAVVAAAALNLALLAVPAHAESRVQPRAHLSASATQVSAGGTVRLTGTLTARGGAMSKAMVRVEKRVHGVKRWTVLTTKRTDARGRISLRTSALRKSQDYRFRVIGHDGIPPVVSNPVSVAAQQKVAITSVSDLHPTAGDVVSIGGAAYPGIADRRAFLQLATSTGWTSVASIAVPYDGAFTIDVRSMRGGEQRYRLLVVGDEGVVPATSAPRTFEVYAWYRLVDQDPLASTSFFGGPQSISGTVFEDSVSVSLTADTAAYVDYDLDYRCRLLRTTLGPADESADGFTARFTAQVDDARPIDVVQAKGSSWSETAEISGGASLRLSSFAAAGAGVAAWGDAEVLCLGRP